MTKKLLLLFMSWRIWLFIVSMIAVYFIGSFGNMFPYADRILIFTRLPGWIWGFGNFDGVHYLKIAKEGYLADFTQAFFPLYPMLIKAVTAINPLVPKDFAISFPQDVERQYFYNAILISNVFFVFLMFLFYKLIKIDYKKDIALKSLALLVFFPTSFYFGSIYTESMFFVLVVLCFLFVRKKKFLIAGIIAGLAAGTRAIGVYLLIPIIIYMAQTKSLSLKKITLNKLITYLLVISFSLSGLLLYMYYLKIEFNNPLYFLTAQPFFGAGRSSLPIITLPQVYWRYFKMIINVPTASYQYFILINELVFTSTALLFVIYAYKKINFSYWIFSVLTIFTSTLTGTFTSMPRYLLGGMLLLPLVVKLSGKYYKYLLIVFIVLNAIFTGLFVRGYWIS